MSDRKVRIEIESTANLKAVEAAQTAERKVGEEAEKANRKIVDKTKQTTSHVNQMGSAASRSAGLFGNLSAAMAAGGQQSSQMSGALSAVGAALASLQAGLLGFISIALAGVISAWIKHNQKVEESKKVLENFRRQIEENKRAQDAAGVDKLAGQYDVLRRAIDDSTAAQDRLNQAQAAAENAQKAADLAELSLREKEAMANTDASAALKRMNPEAASQQETLNKARVTNQFAQERRDIEEKYTLLAAEREDIAKASALRDAERKAQLTQGDVDNAKAAMADFESQIRKANEALADLYGAGAPKKRVASVGTMGAPGGIPTETSTFIIDEAEQKRQAEVIRQRLNEGKYVGGRLTEPTGKGLEPSYQKAAGMLSAAIDRLAKEKVEIQARDIESRAASRAHETANYINPEVNKATTALEERDYLKQQREASLALFKGRAQSLRQSAEINLQSRETQANQFDASDYRSTNAATYGDARQIDRRLDKNVTDAQKLLANAQKLEQTIQAMDPEALARTFQSISRRMDQLDKAIKQSEQRSKNPGFGG